MRSSCSLLRFSLSGLQCLLRSLPALRQGRRFSTSSVMTDTISFLVTYSVSAAAAAGLGLSYEGYSPGTGFSYDRFSSKRQNKPAEGYSDCQPVAFSEYLLFDLMAKPCEAVCSLFEKKKRRKKKISWRMIWQYYDKVYTRQGLHRAVLKKFSSFGSTE